MAKKQTTKVKPAGKHPLNKVTAPTALRRLRALCLALPNTEERISWGTPTFRSPKRIYAMYADAATHAGRRRPGVWIMAAPGRQERMTRTAPTRFFVPPYVGVSGWIGVWLDDVCRWDELADILASAHDLGEHKPASILERKTRA